MNSSIVNKQIKALIKPYLMAEGFLKTSGRGFWKHNEENIYVLNFQSYNSYHAGVMNVTTYSFAVNFGLFWKNLPDHGNIKVKDDLLFPQEYQCSFRHCLKKNMVQPETRYRTVWYVDPNGDHLEAVLDDAFRSIRESIDWFTRLSDKRECIRLLQEDGEDMEGTWGFGNFNSPHRNLLIGHFAYWTGDKKLANESLRKVYDSGSYESWKDHILTLIQLTDK